LCFHHDAIFHFVIHRLHTTNVSFKNVQKNQHHHIEEDRQKDYTISKTYRSIALLNIIEKILEFIMSKKISWITKTHQLLLDTFMKCRKNRSIEMILKLFVEQIHIVWKQRMNRVITLLNLNVTNVFDTMSHVRLIHDMKKKIFELNHRLNQQFFVWLFHDFCNESKNDWIILDANRNFAKFFVFFDFIFVLQCRFIKNVQQTRNEHEIFRIRRWCQYIDLWKKHRRKLSKSEKNAQILRTISDSTWVRVHLDQVRADSLHQKFEETWHDDHGQDRLEHDLIENWYSNSRRADRHTTEMKFTRTKNSKKNNETNHDFHEIVNFHLKNDISQDSNVVHFRYSFDSHLRRFRLIHAQE
jgi:hypothetical protein